jgi:hemerythrin-like domain-containing protein
MAAPQATVLKAVDVMDREHQQLGKIFDELSRVLNDLGPQIQPEILQQVVRSGKWLVEWMPQHYHHEEVTILPELERMGAEQTGISNEIKDQHKHLRVQLERFGELLGQLTGNLEDSDLVSRFQHEGRALIKTMHTHMAFERKEFSVLNH